MSRDCSVALPPSATGLSAVCASGISLSYSLVFFFGSFDNIIQETKTNNHGLLILIKSIFELAKAKQAHCIFTCY